MIEKVPLLLHSLSELAGILVPILEAADIRTVTEIGAETGITTKLLLAHVASQGGGRVVSVDPFAKTLPSSAIPAGVRLEQIFAYSPECLPDLEPTDCYILDGDHNWWTVTAELAAIAGASNLDTPFPLVLFNDVSWPCARRDLYYDPSRIPAEGLHTHTWDDGVTPGDPGIVPGSGFRGAGEFAFAVHEGGPRNGVLTAIEDFIISRPSLELLIVPYVFGLGVLIDKRHSWAGEVARIVAPHTGLLATRLEANRVELYTRVIALEDTSARQVKERRSLLLQLSQLHGRLAERALPPMGHRHPR